MPIRVWDEGRISVNAYEMYKNGNWFVPTCEGKPDMWNTKPPLLIWFDVILFRVLGINILSLRLVSAVAAMSTAFLLFYFSLRYLKSFLFGFLASIALVCCTGYVTVHGTRTGEPDSLLTFFTTLYLMSFFIYLETKSNKYILIYTIGLVLSFMTKGVSGLLFLPGLLGYIIIRKETSFIIFNKHFILNTVISLLIIVGYYLIREHLNPGYLNAVWNNELYGRYSAVLENHSGNVLFYFHHLFHSGLKGVFWLFLFGIPLGLFNKNIAIKKVTLFSTITILSYLLIISLSKTKLDWYLLPLYPFFGLLVAVFIFSAFNFLNSKRIVLKRYYLQTLPYIFLIAILFDPYSNILTKTFKPKEHIYDKETYSISYFLMDAYNGKHNINGYYLIEDGYTAHLFLYQKMLLEKGIHITIKNCDSINNNDVVIAYKEDIIRKLNSIYILSLEKQVEGISIFRVIGLNKPY